MDYIKEIFSLQGKNVIITGGGGVIAAALSQVIAKAGANVALWDIAQDAVSAAVERLKEHSQNKVAGITADTTKEAEVEKAIGETERAIGPPNVLINAAGGNRGKSPFIETDVETFEFVLRLNLIAGLVVPSKVLAKFWIEKDIKGTIINMTSMTSYVPLSGVWAYDAAKAGILNLTMATAKEFAPHGIRVNAIAPGFFVGKQNKALLIKDEATGELTDRGKAIIQRTPFGRFGEVWELAGAAIFLISDKASGFVTGVSLPVDGGYLIDNI